MILSLASAALAVTVADVPNPRPAGAWVSDVADVVDAAHEARLNAIAAAVSAKHGAQIAIVTVPDVDTTPKEFATALFQAWGIGQKGVDDGMLVLLVVGQRRVEMETGYGLEQALPDGWLGDAQVEWMVPHFKAGDYGEGLVAGVGAVAGKLGVPFVGEGLPPSARVAAYSPSEPHVRHDDPTGPAPGVLGLALGGVGVSGMLGVAWVAYRRRQRTCPNCLVLMPMVPETADDTHLDSGQKLEEQLGSVDHQIHICTQCGYAKHLESVAWFSGYGRCGGCQVRAETSSTQTLRSATYDHGGEVRVSTYCKSCHRRDSWTRSTPRLIRAAPSSSSSSRGSSGGGGGGGSFGGGRSGGGGAGSSW